jgi:hypothetical protein
MGNYKIEREVFSNRTNYSKLKVNNIVEITEVFGTKCNCIVLPVTKKDIERGVNAVMPGLYGFRGLWYKGNGTKRMSYGKIYDLAFYDCKVIRDNIKGLSKKQLQNILQ